MTVGACDECEGDKQHISRRYFGKRFCQSCYSRLFIKKPCATCNEVAKLPVFEVEPICQSCVRKEPCVRCQRQGLSVGKLTKKGPVCKACHPYFKPEKTCQQCGKISRFAWNVDVEDKSLTLCMPCANQDHKTCYKCRRYRPVYTIEKDKPICKKCKLEGDVGCRQCGALHPAGYGKICYSCYAMNTFRKRQSIGAQAYENKAVTIKWHQFCDWLLDEVGADRARLKINKFVNLFQSLDTEYGDIPQHEKLLNALGVKALRKYALFKRWAISAGFYSVDEQTEQAFSAQQLINDYLTSFSDDNEATTLLRAYHKKLVSKGSETRSVRLAMTPAKRLLDISKGDVPEQKHIDLLMMTSPGQKASVTGFINFINQQLSLDLVIRDKHVFAKLIENKLAQKMLMLMQEDKPDIEEWLLTGMAYFHGKVMNKKAFSSVKLTLHSVNEAHLYTDNKQYLLPLHDSMHDGIKNFID
ncbi:MAG TPA: hypothetical protein DCR37_01405 [Glaciecola sp.]|nr:hypothetical protein [Glaciecola sp.]